MQSGVSSGSLPPQKDLGEDDEEGDGEDHEEGDDADEVRLGPRRHGVDRCGPHGLTGYGAEARSLRGEEVAEGRHGREDGGVDRVSLADRKHERWCVERSNSRSADSIARENRGSIRDRDRPTEGRDGRRRRHPRGQRPADEQGGHDFPGVVSTVIQRHGVVPPALPR